MHAVEQLHWWKPRGPKPERRELPRQLAGTLTWGRRLESRASPKDDAVDFASCDDDTWMTCLA